MGKFKIGWNDGHTLSVKGTGAVGIIKETDRNRRIGALARKYLLEYENVEIINCTIDKSENDMREAVTKANNSNCNLFISNHVNAGGGKGFETFYSRRSTKANINAAKIIHKHLVATKSCLLNRRCCDDYSFLKYDLYVLINTKMDAILCEIGFVDNRECVSAVNDDEVARAYATGIAEAYGLKKKPVTTTNTTTNETNFNTYTVKIGDTLSAIAVKHGTTYQAIAEINGISRPYTIRPGQVLKLTVTATYHTVLNGENLSVIASKYKTTYQAIAALNGIKSPYTIQPGQKIIIK